MKSGDRGRTVDLMCIGIEKVAETGEAADYAFISEVRELKEGRRNQTVRVGENRGVLRVSKASGEIVLLEPMPEDDGDQRFRRAAMRIKKHWEAGEFPDRTMFACG